MGVILGIAIFVSISMNTTSRVRIPVYLLALPTILLLALVRFTDKALLKRQVDAAAAHRSAAAGAPQGYDQFAQQGYGQPGYAQQASRPSRDISSRPSSPAYPSRGTARDSGATTSTDAPAASPHPVQPVILHRVTVPPVDAAWSISSRYWWGRRPRASPQRGGRPPPVAPSVLVSSV